MRAKDSKLSVGKVLKMGVVYIVLVGIMLYVLYLFFGSPIYKIRLKGADFDNIALALESELSGANMRVFDPPLDIKASMESRGEEFPQYKVYQFCNLEIGKEIFKLTRDFGAFIPCKIYLYEDGEDVVVGTYLASQAMIFLDLPLTGEKADQGRKYIDQIESQILDIMHALKE